MNKKIIITLLIIAVVIGGFVLFIMRGMKRDVQEANQPLFKIESGDNYAFYYPSTYTSITPENGEISVYENPNTKAVQAERIWVSVQAGPGFGQTNYKACEAFSEGFRQTSNDEITVGTSKGETGGEGCEIVVETPIPGTSDAAVMIAKYLWYPDSEDKNLYSAKTAYFKVASADQASALGASVLQFTLK